MKKSEIIILIITLSSFVLGLYLYPTMPDKMVSHWGVQGQPDGFMPKCLGLFLMPFISLGMFLLFALVPRIDPLKGNIDKFRKYFDNFIVIVFLFLFYLYFLTILWNVGVRFNMVQVLSPAFGVLFYYCGILTENAKRNWFIGIKTPWTLSSDNVWDKTHKIGGKLFKIAGALSFLGIFFQSYFFLFVVAFAAFSTAYTVIYSYFEYQKEKKQ